MCGGIAHDLVTGWRGGGAIDTRIRQQGLKGLRGVVDGDEDEIGMAVEEVHFRVGQLTQDTYTKSTSDFLHLNGVLPVMTCAVLLGLWQPFGPMQLTFNNRSTVLHVYSSFLFILFSTLKFFSYPSFSSLSIVLPRPIIN